MGRDCLRTIFFAAATFHCAIRFVEPHDGACRAALDCGLRCEIVLLVVDDGEILVDLDEAPAFASTAQRPHALHATSQAASAMWPSEPGSCTRPTGLMAHRVQREQVLRADFDAVVAGRALFGIDDREAVRIHRDRVERAHQLRSRRGPGIPTGIPCRRR